MEQWPEITKETSIEEVRKIHRRIWDYVVEHGEKPKTIYVGDCDLCEFKKVTGANICLSGCDCSSYRPSKCLNGLYSKWICEMDEYREKIIAEQIRDIPFKGIDA